ncbi:hypothetical protein ACVW2K_000357 [Nocardioides sp. HB32]
MTTAQEAAAQIGPLTDEQVQKVAALLGLVEEGDR